MSNVSGDRTVNAELLSAVALCSVTPAGKQKVDFITIFPKHLDKLLSPFLVAAPLSWR